MDCVRTKSRKINQDNLLQSSGRQKISKNRSKKNNNVNALKIFPPISRAKKHRIAALKTPKQETRMQRCSVQKPPRNSEFLEDPCIYSPFSLYSGAKKIFLELLSWLESASKVKEEINLLNDAVFLLVKLGLRQKPKPTILMSML